MYAYVLSGGLGGAWAPAPPLAYATGPPAGDVVLKSGNGKESNSRPYFRESHSN